MLVDGLKKSSQSSQNSMSSILKKKIFELFPQYCLKFLFQERAAVSLHFQANQLDPFWTGGKDHNGDKQLTWTGK